MVYSIGERKLNCIWKVLENETNGVWIAQDMAEKQDGNYTTLLVVKKHGTAKQLMEIWEAGRKSGRDSCGQPFAYQDEFCVAYPYKKGRPLERFYKSEVHSGKECRQICVNLLAECMGSREAWPVLYLILKQKQIHIEKDRSVFLGYQVDLSQLDPNVGEQPCAVKCAEIILELMQENPEMEKTVGMKLIQKKLQKEGYLSFAELLRDIHMDSGSLEKGKGKEKIVEFFQEKQRPMMRTLLVLSLLLGAVSFLMIVSQMAFGDIPFLRVFTSSFEKIGSESLIR